jgi:tetratricopeptide (TPR) repeat protein
MDRVTRLAHFVAADPENRPLAIDFLDAVLAVGTLDGTESSLELLRARRAADAGIDRRIARIDLVTGRTEAAIEAYMRLLSAEPQDGTLRHDLAFALLASGALDSAEATLDVGATAFASTPELAVLWARCAYLRKDNAQALTRLANSSENVRSLAAAQALEALVRWDAGENAAAIDQAERAVNANPREFDARLVLASAALVDRDGRRAMQWIAPLVETQPRHGRALSVMGQALLLLGDQAAGREALQRAVQFMPDHIGTWHVLAWVHLLAGEVNQAHAAYEQAYAIDRNFGETHGGLALIHTLRGEQEEAHVALRKALRLDPASATAQFARFLLEADGPGRAASVAVLVEAMRGLPELAGIEPEAVLKSLQSRLATAGAAP